MVGVIALLANVANATNVWLSTESSSAIGEVPSVEQRPPGPFGLNIWVRPDEGRQLANFSLNLRTTNPEIVWFDDITVFNPYLGNTPLGTKLFRFEFTEGDEAITSDGRSIENFQGFTVTNRDVIGIGLGPAFQDRNPDPGYDSTTDAWLLGSVHGAGHCCGHADVYLEIGKRGINNDGESSSDTFVVFGAVDDTPLNGDRDRLRPSDTPDATLWFVPKGSSLVMMVIGGVGLLVMTGPGVRRAPA